MARTANRPVTGPAGDRFAQYKGQMESKNSHPIAWHEADEARQQMTIPVGTGKRHLFRSRPGTITSFAVFIPHLPDTFKTERHEEVMTRLFDNRRAREDGENPPFDLESVRLKNGGDYIRFKYAPGRQVPGEPGKTYRGFCYYETDDDEIAAFLMYRKSNKPNGPWVDIVVEHPKTTFEINGQTFPATAAGWKAAEAAVLAGVDNPQKDKDDASTTSTDNQGEAGTGG